MSAESNARIQLYPGGTALQWGRTLMSAESARDAFGVSHPIYVLQWGRTLMSAESATRLRSISLCPARFNGAAL